MRKEERKAGGGGVRGTLARLAAPALTSQRRACSLPSTSPPLALCAPQPLLHYSPNPSTPSPFCLVPLHWAATARLAQRVGAECAGEHVCMCVNISLCVCVGKAWVLVACRSVLQCFLTFFFFSSFSHMALNNQVLPKDCT